MPNLHELKQSVYSANMSLPRHGLVILTWGNVSGIDRDAGLVVIKPSGVSYDELSPENMTCVDMDGNVVEGALKPSADTATQSRNDQSLAPTDRFGTPAIASARPVPKPRLSGAAQRGYGNFRLPGLNSGGAHIQIATHACRGDGLTRAR